MPIDNTVVVPGPVVGAYQRWRWTAVSCYPRQMTWRLERDATTHYLKVGFDGDHPGLRAEAERTRWAASWLPVPEVLDVGTDGTVEWPVTAGLDGRPATDPDLGEPGDVVVAWAEGLRRFHELAPSSQRPDSHEDRGTLGQRGMLRCLTFSSTPRVTQCSRIVLGPPSGAIPAIEHPVSPVWRSTAWLRETAGAHTALEVLRLGLVDAPFAITVLAIERHRASTPRTSPTPARWKVPRRRGAGSPTTSTAPRDNLY